MKTKIIAILLSLASVAAVIAFAPLGNAQTTQCDWQPYGATGYEITTGPCVPTELAVYVRAIIAPTPVPSPTAQPTATASPTATPQPQPTATAGPTPTTAPPTATPVPPTPTPAPPSGVQFVETFDTPASLDRFNWALHHAWVWGATDQSWIGDHDVNCGGADTSRIVLNPTAIDGTIYYPGRPANVVYWCRQHMMTSFNTNHYSQIDFSPAQVFNDVTEVCWDQNMSNTGNRAWTQMAVISEARFQANGQRLDYVRPSLESGPGAAGVFLAANDFLFEYNLGATTAHTGRSTDQINNPQFATNDKATRYTICVEDQGNGTIRVELGRPGGVEIRVLSGAFPDGPSRVIFQDDKYNPDKASGGRTPNPYTWHWDNIVVD